MTSSTPSPQQKGPFAAWHQKTRIGPYQIHDWKLIFGSMFIVFIIVLFNLPSPAERKAHAKQEALRVQQHKAQQVREDAALITAQVEELRAGIGAIQNLKAADCKESAELCLSLMNGFAQSLQSVLKKELTPQQISIKDSFQKELKSFQEQAMPIIRNAYGSILRQKLWEYDVSSRTYGQGFRKVEFTGGAFASNRNIKSMHENIRPLLIKLRFETATYQWRKDGDGTIFTMRSPFPDSAIIAWDDQGRFYEVSRK